MTNAKNVYALMLALVIVLSGCFGNTAPETDGQSNDQTNNQSSNIAPLIEIDRDAIVLEGTELFSSTTGESIGYTHWNISIFRALKDLDGTIASAGWDFDLDGIIDQNSTNFHSIDNLSIPSSVWHDVDSFAPEGGFTPAGYSVWDMLVCSEDYDDEEDELGPYCGIEFEIATIAFIAIDDDGATSAELVTVDTFTFNLMENSLAADQPESGTRNSYTATDASAATSEATDDTLMRITWQHAEDDLNWAFVVMKLTVGDNTFDCSTGADEECSIAQDGGDDALWETGEFLTLSENGNDIASTTTDIGMYVTYRGTAVAGTGDVTVA